MIDGNLLKITDFSKGMIPPPMCNLEEKFDEVILGVDIKSNHMLIMTEEFVYLYDYSQKTKIQYKIGALKEARFINLEILRIAPLLFMNNKNTYIEK